MICRLMSQDLFSVGLKRYISYYEWDDNKVMKIVPFCWSLQNHLHLRFVSSGINDAHIYFSNCGNKNFVQRIRRFNFDKGRNNFHIVDNSTLISIN